MVLHLSVTRAFAALVLASKLQPQVTLDSILGAWAASVCVEQAGSRTCTRGSGALVLCFRQERWGTCISAEHLFPPSTPPQSIFFK